MVGIWFALLAIAVFLHCARSVGSAVGTVRTDRIMYAHVHTQHEDARLSIVIHSFIHSYFAEAVAFIHCTVYSSLLTLTHCVCILCPNRRAICTPARQGMATIDFYCSEHTIPPTYSSRSKSTSTTATTHCSKQSHSISNKLAADDRRLAVLLEQEQRFTPNAYNMHKAVNECERMQLLETLLQIEVRLFIL